MRRQPRQHLRPGGLIPNGPGRSQRLPHQFLRQVGRQPHQGLRPLTFIRHLAGVGQGSGRRQAFPDQSNQQLRGNVPGQAVDAGLDERVTHLPPHRLRVVFSLLVGVSPGQEEVGQVAAVVALGPVAGLGPGLVLVPLGDQVVQALPCRGAGQVRGQVAQAVPPVHRGQPSPIPLCLLFIIRRDAAVGLPGAFRHLLHQSPVGRDKSLGLYIPAQEVPQAGVVETIPRFRVVEKRRPLFVEQSLQPVIGL